MDNDEFIEIDTTIFNELKNNDEIKQMNLTDEELNILFVIAEMKEDERNEFLTNVNNEILNEELNKKICIE